VPLTSADPFSPFVLTILPLTGGDRAQERSPFAAGSPWRLVVVSRLLFDPVSHENVEALTELLTAVRDHMRTKPPRSADLRPAKRSARQRSRQ
jgi:hypothetical protein